MPSWADLDKLALAKPREGGATSGRMTAVIVDDRAPDAIADTRALSTLVAISRVVRGRRVLAERDEAGSEAVIVYSVRGTPPLFLIDAVSAAGGVVFDGKQELKSPRPLGVSVQLDAAFVDLATAVRRRLRMKTFADALDVLEHEVRRRQIPRDQIVAWWTAVFELAALGGELVRADRPARWVPGTAGRLPLALELAPGTQVLPGQLAQAIVDGAAGTLRSLVQVGKLETARAASKPAPSRPMPLLCARDAVPLDRVAWTPIVDVEADHPALPVIVWVEDHAGAIRFPEAAAITPDRRAVALDNVAGEITEIDPVELPHVRLAIVTGGFYAAESLLSAAAMERVRLALGGATTLLVAVPARGHLIAIPAATALVDDDVMTSFLIAVEREYLRAPERDRISSQVIIYAEKPIGRVQSNLLDARQLLRDQGLDPDDQGLEDL
ncbi:MAG TPA: hypothetical protein VFQ53_00170 [Kofleriaceae bacterium]|nr:hypothetical protein [Kofleriaceae bacterium]